MLIKIIMISGHNYITQKQYKKLNVSFEVKSPSTTQSPARSHQHLISHRLSAKTNWPSASCSYGCLSPVLLSADLSRVVFPPHWHPFFHTVIVPRLVGLPEWLGGSSVVDANKSVWFIHLGCSFISFRLLSSSLSLLAVLRLLDVSSACLFTFTSKSPIARC